MANRATPINRLLFFLIQSLTHPPRKRLRRFQQSNLGSQDGRPG
jgi:hypothetical protein